MTTQISSAQGGGRNRLAAETSPYLLQHKDNPVAWWAWGPEALAEAKRSNRPILLSIGYAACHWCHVMAHESFEDPDTAALMNALFVNIKVDREERPDVDALYMRALHLLGQRGGWPLTMFLTADAEPFYGGTYFPPRDRYGQPAFKRVLTEIARIYHEEPEKARSNAESLMTALRAAPPAHTGVAPLSLSRITEIAKRMVEAVDPLTGGIAGAPKFPQFNFFWFLWKAGIRLDLPSARAAVVTTLRNIAQGGIYDHIGGGFARYSVDDRWLVPHFEKMLYDNALLVRLLTEVWRETREPLFACRVAETIDWLLTDMLVEGGGFAASFDADAEGQEGKFTVWSRAEIAELLGPAAQEFCSVYDITDTGNFEGHNIPNRLARLELGDAALEERLAQARAKLLAQRRKRVPPGWDDKVLTDWNGLAITALAEAARAFERPDWLGAAEAAYRFVQQRLTVAGRLRHAWRAGSAKAPATSADYANMIQAALTLYQVRGDQEFLADARAWQQQLDRHYRVRSGAYAQAADDTTDLVARLADAHDDATPNANATTLTNLAAFSLLETSGASLQAAEDLCAHLLPDVARSSAGHAGVLSGLLDLASPLLIVILDPADGAGGDLGAAVRSLSLPDAVVVMTDGSDAIAGSPMFGKVMRDGRPTAYVCVGSTCSRPVTEPDALKRLVTELRGIAAYSVEAGA